MIRTTQLRSLVGTLVRLAAIVCVVLAFSAPAAAQIAAMPKEMEQVKVQEHLDGQLPLDTVFTNHEGKKVLVVSHGTALNCLVSTLLGMSESHVFRLEIANCGLTEVEVRKGVPYVLRVNDTAHLAGL